MVLVVPQHWERALIRAELIERGHDAVGMQGLGDLLLFRTRTAAAAHGPVGLVLVDREALTGRRQRLLGPVRACYPDVPFLLLAGGTTTMPGGPWTAVLLRPISIGDIATRIEDLLEPASSLRPRALVRRR